VSPWLGAPPGQHGSVTKAQKVARGVAEGLDQAVTGGMVKAGVRGDKALAKQAAVNAAALGAGYIAGKAIQTAAGAVAKTGVLARVVNKVTKQELYLHGSPTTGLKEIFPTMGKNRQWSQERGLLGFYENPKASVGYQGGMASAYARPRGSVYIVKGPKGSFTKDPENLAEFKVRGIPLVAISKQPQKVVSEIKYIDIGRPYEHHDVETVAKTLKKLGFKQPKKR